MKYNKDDLLFVPLGGSNEIGMNVNLYHYKGKWLMIDLGAVFASDRFPGIQMVAPDLEFVQSIKDDFLGIFLTHAHEDHLGAVGFLWDELRCPIYATPFTAGMVKSKLDQAGLANEAKITIVQENDKLSIGPFDLEMVHLAHSIPEMNAVILKTDKGNIFHSGDWKFDDNPVIGGLSDVDQLKKIGDEGVLALVCDSTNVFNEKDARSEGDLYESMRDIIAKIKGLAVITTFASNVARVQTIAKAAKANGRKVVLAGYTLHKVTTLAREVGYLKDVDLFISDKEMNKYSRDKLLVIATGCQGDYNAATNKIASGIHPSIRLTSKDSIVFSSKVIPGNEKKIFALYNKFARMNVEVFTEKDHFVHVSGHPSRDCLKKMYKLIRPEIVIPVHGEPVHLREHAKLAREVGIPKQHEIQNGEMVRISESGVESMKHVKFGYLGVDGYQLLPEDGEVLKSRRRMMHEGIVMVSIVMTREGGLAVEPIISAPGVIDKRENHQFFKSVEDELVEVIDAQNDTSNDRIYKIVKRTIGGIFKSRVGKRPPVEVQISRV